MKRLTTILTIALLSMLTFSFSSCEPMDDFDTATVLNGTWHGSLGQYYNTVYGPNYGELETEFRFNNYSNYATSGDGIEIDYDPNMWSDYTYYQFRWEVANGNIYMHFTNGDELVIHNYYLSDNRLSGQLRSLLGQFVANLDLTRTSYWPWGSSFAKATRAAKDGHAGNSRNLK